MRLFSSNPLWVAFLLIVALGLAVTFAEAREGGFTISSGAFQPKTFIPKRYTCEGQDISPELSWQNPPAGTKSFMLVVHDPDAPLAGGWTHWVLTGIPAHLSGLPEAVPPGDAVLKGLRHGRNSWGKRAYGGPCPPPGHGRHRYFFRLYALDVGPEKDLSWEEAKKSALGVAEIMGYYER